MPANRGTARATAKVALIALAGAVFLGFGPLPPLVDLPSLPRPDLPDVPDRPDWLQWLMGWPRLVLITGVIALVIIDETRKEQAREREASDATKEDDS